jgi:hypothetical protein
MTERTTAAEVWHLRYHGEEVARLEVTDSDFPWLIAIVRPSPRFSEVRGVFDEEASQIEAPVDEVWEQLYHRIRADFELVRPDGFSVPEFLLHIEGDRASWRWSDTAFDGESS